MQTIGFLTFFLGLITTLNGVGGVDASTTNFELIVSTTIAAVGVAIMGMATTYITKEA